MPLALCVTRRLRIQSSLTLCRPRGVCWPRFLQAHLTETLKSPLGSFSTVKGEAAKASSPKDKVPVADVVLTHSQCTYWDNMEIAYDLAFAATEVKELYDPASVRSIGQKYFDALVLVAQEACPSL